jgi:hypothetical protein
MGIYSKMCEFGGTQAALCDSEECRLCFDRSFASYKWVGEHYCSVNKLNPRQVKKQLNPVWFKCKVCLHTFKRSAAEVLKSECFCHFCETMSLCENEDCMVCFNNSFASSVNVRFWSLNNGPDPRQIHKMSKNNCYLKCYKCGTDRVVGIVDCYSEKNWCPCCNDEKKASVCCVVL